MTAKQNGNGNEMSSVRPALREAITSSFTAEYFKELVESVKTMTKSAWSFCPNCQKSVQVPIPDVPKMIGALTELIEQVEGRPGTTDVEKGGITLIVERHWPSPEKK